ncbi:hypothetical protein EV682_12911 [Iodobacter fluviatilis]|uniref:Uncharacterized protein n=1 Tax=Iodobacter fluviatilis TaxID=537 RepID=A0A377Q2D3_9NEIS|nr:hypothetical protein EV682_12911 [Iodobacter fluviatilis]STQ88997.1 Uncharacterised protein [Iodobacter fluviatilis]
MAGRGLRQVKSNLIPDAQPAAQEGVCMRADSTEILRPARLIYGRIDTFLNGQYALNHG